MYFLFHFGILVNELRLHLFEFQQLGKHALLLMLLLVGLFYALITKTTFLRPLFTFLIMLIVLDHFEYMLAPLTINLSLRAATAMKLNISFEMGCFTPLTVYFKILACF